MHLEISLLECPAVDALPLEIVERKGLGHLDCQEEVQIRVNEIVHHHLETLGSIWRELITGSILLF